MPSTLVHPTTPRPEVGFVPMQSQHLEAVIQIEQRCYSHPWTRSHFADVLAAGHTAQLLLAGPEQADAPLLGYFVAMNGVQETHLLNLTVAPEHQGQGWAKTMLQALSLWSRGQDAQHLWLEVRASNARALSVYRACGFEPMGLRKGYYPGSHPQQREDALTMRLDLTPPPSTPL